jgi:alpha-tubulin suppressor-like RCC1 family protein
MPVNYQVGGSNFEDVFIRRDLFAQGGLWMAGSNGFGQLGINNTTNRSSPVQTIAAGTNWKQVETSANYHTAGIKTDGTLWLWGYNANGNIGDNSNLDKSSPVQTVAAGTNWKQVSCDYMITAAIKTDGTLWTWGKNNVGQLGDGTTSVRSSPVQTIASGSNWKLVASGVYHMAAIKTNGTLWMWGYAANGELGDNTRTNKSSPVQTISAGTNWKLVACGYYSTCAIKTDGTLWTWGENAFGQLGDNTGTNKSSPVQTVAGGTNWKQVSAKWKHVAAIKTDGSLWLWGENDYGQLGDGTRSNKSSPVQTVSAGTNWKVVSGGIRITGAIKTDGTLWFWGNNDYGQLQINTTSPNKVSSPVQTVAGGTNWKQVSASYATAAIKDDF